MQDDNKRFDLRSRLGVIRHRLSERRIPASLTDIGARLSAVMTDRRRALALGAAALAIGGLAAAGTAIGGEGPATVAATAGLADRGGPERADRSDRTSAGDAQAPSVAPSSTPPAAVQSTPASPAVPAPPKPKPAWVNPMPGAEVTSCYGPRWGTLHQGVDFAAPPSTPVRAVGAGVVVGAGWLYSGYGISVMIDHGNGYRTHYAHLKFAKVSPGQRVSADQMIGGEGSTGDSTGPHLHFEVHRGEWGQVEPASWLRARGVKVPGC